MSRLDEFLVAKGYFDSRTKAKQSILRGEISVNGKLVDKPSTNVDGNVDLDIVIQSEKSFVSLGGYKLDKALTEFDIDVKGMVCADIGASTGGFTDCLLQRGAKRVYAVDLNDKLLHSSLKSNPNVIEIIANAKDLTAERFDEDLQIITADLSFISASLVMNVFYNLIDFEKLVILLIKPQFENKSKIKFKNGIIKDSKVREEACVRVINCAIECGFYPLSITNAPIQKDKNVEYLLLLKKSRNKISDLDYQIFYNFIHKLTNNH